MFQPSVNTVLVFKAIFIGKPILKSKFFPTARLCVDLLAILKAQNSPIDYGFHGKLFQSEKVVKVVKLYQQKRKNKQTNKQSQAI